MVTLTAEEISRLMSEARKMGATNFKYGEIVVDFAPVEKPVAKEIVNPATGLTPSEEVDWFASSES